MLLFYTSWEVYTKFGTVSLRRFLPAARAHSAQSGPAMVNFNGAPYSHLHSLQGDVAGIVDYAENLVVEYKYNPWGKPILL